MFDEFAFSLCVFFDLVVSVLLAWAVYDATIKCMSCVP